LVNPATSTAPVSRPQSPLGYVSLAIALSFGLLGALLALYTKYALDSMPPEDVGRASFGIASLFLALPLFVCIGGALLGALSIGVGSYRSTAALCGAVINALACVAMWPVVIPVLAAIARR
jgi:hypothetical protein